MSKTKIQLGEAQIESLATAIEDGVKIAVQEYTDAKVAEELEPIYGHLEEILRSIGELAERVNTVTQHLSAHIEGATNDIPTYTNPGAPVRSGDFD